MKNKIVIASDHAAFKEKAALVNWLKAKYDVLDLGTNDIQSTHYPIYAKKLALHIQQNGGVGILLCGSGIGVSMVANKFKGIRAALCNEISDARLAKEHNNANIICLSGRKHDFNHLKVLIQTWLGSEFEGGRHQTRIDLFDQLGEA